MRREELLERLASDTLWDVLIIGGGATGLGASVDAASRGYKTILLEQADFAHGTSSRSTKLIHGGFRYLRQAQFGLVRQGLRERSLLLRLAAPLVHPQSFIIPLYSLREKIVYGSGLILYELLAGRSGLGAPRFLSAEEARKHIPTLEPHGLKGGIKYYDGQFEDARMAIALAETAVRHGATVLNYFPVLSFIREGALIRGVVAKDIENGHVYEIRARSVINAAGVFADQVRKLDDQDAPPLLTFSRGSHLLLSRAVLPGDSALMVPKTSDGRVVFAIPRYGRVLVGTTDVPVSAPELEPVPSAEEISFLLRTIEPYLGRVEQSNIVSVFAGHRPLVQQGGTARTKDISRDHSIIVSPSSLLSIVGGKWTSYRQMAEDIVTAAAENAGLSKSKSRTRTLPILHEPREESASELLHPELPITASLVRNAVQHEFARTVDDILLRRTRAGFIHPNASLEAAPKVAALIAKELGRDKAWEERQLAALQQVIARHLPR